MEDDVIKKKGRWTQSDVLTNRTNVLYW